MSLASAFSAFVRPRASATARLERTVKPCVMCGGEEAYVVPVDVVPDFDSARLEAGLREALLTKQNGYCTMCGLYQDFNRLTPALLKAMNALGKDALTTDPAYDSYPPSADFVAAFDARHFSQRLRRWDAFLDMHAPSLDTALFLRVWFGAA